MGKVKSTTLVTNPRQLPRVEAGQTSIIMQNNLRSSLQKSSNKSQKQSPTPPKK